MRSVHRRLGSPAAADTLTAVSTTTRLLLGIATALCLAVGGALIVWGSDTRGGEVLVRVGLLLGAAWLVAPLVRRPSLATIGLLVGAALLVIRPRLVFVLPVFAIVWRLSRRRPPA